MNRRIIFSILIVLVMICVCACGKVSDIKESPTEENKPESVDSGTETYNGFVLDNVLHSESNGDIHYNLYVPDDYDGSVQYALFITLPGYQGLYFQGVGANVKTEEFGYIDRKSVV